MSLSVDATQLVVSEFRPAPRPSPASARLYDALAARAAGGFDPMSVPAAPATLLRLSTAEQSTGLTMFDVLADAFGVTTSVRAALAAYAKSL